MKRVKAIAALIIAAASASPALATNYYWDTTAGAGAGSAPSGTWSAGGTTFNLDSTGTSATAAQTTGSGDALFFVAGPGAASGNGAYTVTLSGTQSANSLNFQSSGAPTFSAAANTINLYGGGINMPQFAFGATDQGAVTISTAIALQANQTWTNDSINNLTSSGLISGNFSITKSGTGTLILSNALSAYSGGFSLSGGTLRLGANSNGTTLTPYPSSAVAGPLGTGTLTIAGGTTLTSGDLTARVIANAVTLNGSSTFGVSTTFTGALTFANQVTLGADIAPTFNVATTFGGLAWNTNRSITNNSGATAVTVHGWLSGGANTLTLQGSGTGMVFGDATAPVFGTGNLQVGTASSAYSVKNGVAGNTIRGDLNLPNFAGNQFDLNSQNLTISSLSGGGSSGGIVTSAAGTPTVVIAGPTGSATFDGVISGTGVKLIKAGGNTQTLTRNQTFTGTTSIYAGTLTLSNAATLTNSATPYTVLGGTLNLDNNAGGAMVNRLTDAQAISLGSMTLTGTNGGGGAMVETVGALTLSTPGTITVNNGNVAGDRTTLAFGAVTRNAGSAINFVGTNGTLGGGANSPNVTSTGAWAGTTNGILPWATVGGTLWAENNTNSVRAYSGTFVDPTSAASNAASNSQLSGSGSIGTAKAFNSLNVISTASGQSLTLNANLNLTAGGAILKSGTDAYTIGGSSTLGSGAAGLGTELIAHVSGGDLTISAPLNTAIINIAQGGSGKLILSGTRGASLTTIGIGGTLQLEGASTTLNGVVSGPGALIANLNSGQALTLSGVTGNTFAGGVTLGANTSLNINANSSLVGGAITASPLGLGVLTIGGGANTVIKTDVGRAVYNDLIINGDFSVSALTGSGGLTVDPQSRGDFGSIQLNGARTINAVANTLQLNGPIIGASSPSLTLKGLGTVSLQNNTSTASTFGNLTIGDAYVPTGAQGGNVIVNSQNAMGSGAVTINYGGNLNIGNGTTTSLFGNSNNITVNPGGSVQLRFGVDTNITPTGVLTLGNMATVGWHDLNLTGFFNYNYTLGTTLTGLPTAGAIYFNGSDLFGNVHTQVNIAGAYPSLTGTLVLGGGNTPGDPRNGNKVIFSGVTTLSSVDGVARTLGLNDQGGYAPRNGLLTVLGGVALNADLTLKGSGNAGLSSGKYPVGIGSEVGSLTPGTNGNHALTVNMSPVGVATVQGPAVGNPGVNAVTINSGWLGVDAGAGTSSGKVFSNSAGGITLNGGGITVGMAVQQTNPVVTLSDNLSIGVKGGSILAGAYSGNVTLTLSGQLSGSGALTLMAGRQFLGNYGNNTGSNVGLTGNNSGYTGNITLARTGGWGGFLFSGVNSTGASNTITAPNGTGFGFDSLATAVALMPKFVTGTETVLDLANLTGGTINLSNTGPNALNFSGRLGNNFATNANQTISNPITPYDSTGYRFAGGANTISFNTANILTGAFPVDFAHVANAPGQINGIASSLYSITSSQNFQGAFTMDGNGPAATAYNAAMFVNDPSVGSTRASFITTIGTGGDFSTASSIGLNNFSQVSLSGTNGKISSTAGGTGLPVTVQGSAVLQIGDSTAATTNNDGAGGVNRLGGSTARVTLGGSNGGGILQLAYGSAAGNPSQTLSSLTVNSGQSAILSLYTATAVAGPPFILGPSGTLSLTISNPTIARSTGGTLYLPFPTANFPGVTLTGATTTSGAATNGWMYVPLVGGNNGGANGATVAVTSATFAAIDGSGRLVAISPTVNNINTAGADFVNTAGGTYTLTADTSVNTLTLNTTTAVDTSTKKLTVTTGGIIANIAGTSITGSGAGGLTSGFNHELIVNSAYNAAGTFTISAPILQDAGNNNIDLTKVGGGSTTASVLALSNVNNRIGNVWISGGAVRVDTGAGSLGVDNSSSNSITLEGGALSINLTGSSTFNQAINVLSRGFYSSSLGVTQETNFLILPNTNQSTTFTGPIAIGSPLQLSPAGGSTLTLSGPISGGGGLITGTAGTSTRTTVVLSGNNSSFSGTVLAYLGAHLRLENTNAAGTGSILGQVYTSTANQNASLYFGTGASGITLANDVVNLQTLVNWNTGAASETYTGAISTGNGLTFQGNATSTSAVGETVLAGNVSVNGIAQAYNWSTTPTTSIQNFVNGQGGINAGVTNFSGITQFTTAAQNPLGIDSPAGGGAFVSNGALGFVRFSGANSFLPGSVGPGYIAALAKASAGSDAQYGYLLTATAANGGSTYNVPEGKGFVIGSLGAGTQVSGVLGVSGGGTATLLGGPKAAAGQLTTGFAGGDINLHANGAADTQALTFLARASGDNLVLGDSTHPIVITPTYGDSGATTAITFLAKRTGLNTFNKIGPGTVTLNNIAYTNTDGTSAASQVTWNVTGGTLAVAQTSGLGSGNVTVGTASANTGTLDVGAGSPLTVDLAAATYTQNAGGSLKLQVNSSFATNYSVLKTTGTTALNGTLALVAGSGGPTADATRFEVLDTGTRSGNFTGYTVSGLGAGKAFDTSRVEKTGELSVVNFFNGFEQVNGSTPNQFNAVVSSYAFHSTPNPTFIADPANHGVATATVGAAQASSNNAYGVATGQTNTINFGNVPAFSANVGPASDLGGYSNTFGSGFTVQADVYLDPAIAGAANATGFDLSAAASNSGGTHLRDFIFHVVKTGTNQLRLAATNNTTFVADGVQVGAQAAIVDGSITTPAGWYTMQYAFQQIGANLGVRMQVFKPGDEITPIFDETRLTSDAIAGVGGNNYLWFTNIDQTGGVKVDNVKMLQGTVASPLLLTNNTTAIGTVGNLSLTPELASFELGGTTPGAAIDGYDILRSTNGTLTLSGNLELALIDDFELQITSADAFTILSAQSLTGAFNNVTDGQRVATADGAGSFVAHYQPLAAGGTALVLTDFQSSLGDSVPEPAAAGIVSLCAATTLLRRRTRALGRKSA